MERSVSSSRKLVMDVGRSRREEGGKEQDRGIASRRGRKSDEEASREEMDPVRSGKKGRRLREKEQMKKPEHSSHQKVEEGKRRNKGQKGETAADFSSSQVLVCPKRQRRKEEGMIDESGQRGGNMQRQEDGRRGERSGRTSAHRASSFPLPPLIFSRLYI